MSIDYEAYRKRGKGWQSLGIFSFVSGTTLLQCARYVARSAGCKVVGIRPADTTIPPTVYRFDKPDKRTGKQALATLRTTQESL